MPDAVGRAVARDASAPQPLVMRTLQMPSPTACPTTSPRRLARRAAVASTTLLLALGACRADGVVAPAQPGDATCDLACTPAAAAPAPGASIVIAPLEDAIARILPSVTDARTRVELTPVLDALRQDLLGGRLHAARLALARSYDAVDLADARLSGSGDDAVVLDLADLSAIRLALVPASRALGVAVP